MNNGAAIRGYNDISINAGVTGASAHGLIQMLFDGLLERIAQAKGGIQQKNIELKGQKINQAISIVLGLKSNLDLDNGGELAERLNHLYDYIQQTLWSAHKNNDVVLLDECVELITSISSAWRDIEKQIP